jgi:hypothetical protein
MLEEVHNILYETVLPLYFGPISTSDLSGIYPCIEAKCMQWMGTAYRQSVAT